MANSLKGELTLDVATCNSERRLNSQFWHKVALSQLTLDGVN